MSLFEDEPPEWASSQYEVVRNCLEAGVRAAHPRNVVSSAVSITAQTLRINDEAYDLSNIDRILVVGGGNAAGTVAEALESAVSTVTISGAVVTDGTASTDHIQLLAGDHPLPTARNVTHTQQMQAIADDATENDLVIAIVTGGGSALMEDPAGDITVRDFQQVTEQLMKSGAAIDEMNAIRRHLSSIKGGQLAQSAQPATTVGLLLSDVVGDDPSVIASGPTVPDETTFGDVLDIVEKYDIEVPDAVREYLEKGGAGEYSDTPDTESSVFDSVTNHIIGTGRVAMNASAAAAEEHGYESMVLSASIRGEASEAGRFHVAIAEEIQAASAPVTPPAAVISGGETTVTVEDDGTGGPNQEFILGCATELENSNVVIGSIDTDGLDGSTDVAGAIIDSNTICSSNASRHLKENNAYPLLERHNAHLKTGKTGTNVNDLRVLIVGRPSSVN